MTAVVPALAEQPATWRYAAELCERLDLTAGRVYPVLMRLADTGLLETAWETAVPAGQRPRHRYRLTGPGRALAAELAGCLWLALAPPRARWRGEAVWSPRAGPGQAQNKVCTLDSMPRSAS